MAEKEPTATLSEAIQEISGMLSKKRQSRNLSFEEVSHVLKIRVPILKALEEGQWDQVPGGVYLENFIRKYAAYLGLDPKKTVEPYLNAKNQGVQNELKGEKSFNWSENPSKMYWVLGGGGLLLLLLLMKLFSNRPPTSRTEMRARESVSQVASPAKTEAERAKVSAENHKVAVYTPYPLWIRLESNDRPFEGFIPQGSTWTWSAKGQFSVRFGHTKEVAMFVNGQKIDLKENQKQFDMPNAN